MDRTPCRALTAEPESEAKALAQRIRELAEEEFLQIARLLVIKFYLSFATDAVGGPLLRGG